MQEFLRERFRSFQPCCGGTRPEAGQVSFFESVTDAGHQRLLRTDNGQGYFLDFGEIDQGVNVIGVHIDISDLVLHRGTGISGCNNDLRNIVFLQRAVDVLG